MFVELILVTPVLYSCDFGSSPCYAAFYADFASFWLSMNFVSSLS